MKLFLTLLTVIISFSLGQDRSLIFSTGSPDGTEGHTIEWDGTTGQSVSDRIYISGNMVLEAMRIYAEAISDSAVATVILQTDDNGIPGEVLYSWEVDVAAETHGSNSFLIITTDLCIYLDEGNYYWLTLHAADTGTQLNWLYSNNPTYTYTTTNDQGISWETPIVGNCGALAVWAEPIYEPEIEETIGDINEDGGVNVLDVVILANAILINDNFPAGDINEDGVNNVLDIVGLVQIVLNGPPAIQLPSWDYIDINSNSDYFGQLIGPDTFSGDVSLYYFGKAG